MKFEIYQEKAQGLNQANLLLNGSTQYRWRLIANNGEIIADSGEGYSNKADCQHGINLVKSTNESTPVVDLTGNGLAGMSVGGLRHGTPVPLSHMGGLSQSEVNRNRLAQALGGTQNALLKRIEELPKR